MSTKQSHKILNMSRTKKIKSEWKEKPKGKKMQPYQSQPSWVSFKAEVSPNRKYATKAARDEARNANRSLKKGERQRAKNEIRRLGY